MFCQMKRCLTLLLLFSISLFISAEEQLIRYPLGDSGADFRYAYPVRVLQLALDKTAPEYGPARAVNVTEPMNTARIQTEIEKGKMLDVFTSGASRDLEKRLMPVPICIRKGILGIRLFLIDGKKQSKFADIKTLADLKKVPIGQGFDWLDTLILKKNGFNIVTGKTYEGLFPMLMRGRFDLFSRGLYEPFPEIKQHSIEFPDLALEKGLALYYPDPDFFWVRKDNKMLAERLQKGLELAIADGSFDKLFDSEFAGFIQQADLEHRLIFTVPNPELDKVPFAGDPKYWFIEQIRRDGKHHFVD